MRTEVQTPRAKIVITTGRDCGSAEWINLLDIPFTLDEAVVCGGNVDEMCYTYDPSTDVWVTHTNMSSKREYAAAVDINSNDWWISGGFYSDGISSEIYNAVTESFTPYVDLPEMKFSHQIVQLNDTDYMLLTGSESTRSTWMFK